MVAETIGAIPKPQRVLTQPYTVEPTQEGERSVILRRVGNIQGHHGGLSHSRGSASRYGALWK